MARGVESGNNPRRRVDNPYATAWDRPRIDATREDTVPYSAPEPPAMWSGMTDVEIESLGTGPSGSKAAAQERRRRRLAK